jgi:hypothetical protein
LDLRSHHAVVEHTSGRAEWLPLTPNRAVGEVTRDVLAAVRRVAGSVDIDPRPQEVPWHVPLDEDRDHATYDPDAVGDYFAAATRAAQVLADFRAPFRGRCTPVACWWGAFDVAVSVFSGASADPPSDDFISRNSADAKTVAVGWWPGDARYPRAAFYGYAFPAIEGLATARVTPDAARWDDDLTEFILDWDDVRAQPDPHAEALAFARSVFRAASALGDWGELLTGSMTGTTPPLRPRRPVPPQPTQG